MFEAMRQHPGQVLPQSPRHQVHLRDEVRPRIADFSDMRHPQQSRQGVPCQQERSAGVVETMTSGRILPRSRSTTADIAPVADTVWSSS